MKKIVFLISVLVYFLAFKAFAQNPAVATAPAAASVDPSAAIAAVQADNTVSVNPLANVTNILAQATKTSEALKQRNELVNSLLGNNKPTSLMFDDDEKENANRAIDSFKSGQQFVSDSTEKTIVVDSKNGADKSKQDQEDNAKAYVYLASILYTDKKNWSIWISGNKITSQDNDEKKELYVKSISQDEVKMRWTLSISKWKILSGKLDEVLAPKINANNQVEINFTLKPNQTYVLNAYQTIEGHATPKSQASSGITSNLASAVKSVATGNTKPSASNATSTESTSTKSSTTSDRQESSPAALSSTGPTPSIVTDTPSTSQ